MESHAEGSDGDWEPGRSISPGLETLMLSPNKPIPLPGAAALTM